MCGVPFFDIDLGGGVSDVGESVLRDSWDGWVDLVEANMVAGTTISG
jgi:hypothetical protein